jgi:DNA-binding transcriptional regulator YdaS (Cro superfamily)
MAFMALEHDLDSTLAAAVRAAGSQSAFGRLIGKRQSTVHEWLKTGACLPAEHVRTVEAELGISRHDLRPDLYPREAPAAGAADLEPAR